MKYAFFTFLAILVNFSSFAQTQQGIVKTRGRMVNGQLVPGTRLSGATITLSIGNPLVSGNQGAFSFNVPSGKNYSLVAAKKQGYTLADPEYTRRSFKYSSSNPFYVVLEDEAQRQADINAATRKVRKTLTAQLEKREEEIEALKLQNKITEKEYQERLQQLYDNQSNSEKLVKEMAERYASTDYDQLDEFNRQVQLYIEEGDLQKADSMIRSKGDIEQRVTEYHNVVAANKKEREELRAREIALKNSAKRLQQSETAIAKTYDDLIQDLNRCHEIFVQQHKPDSALFYLKMLADLDTTNIEITYKYAYSAYGRLVYDEALKYAQITLRNADVQENFSIIAFTENIIGLIYMVQNRLDESKEMYLRSLEHIDNLLTRYKNAYYLHNKTMPTFNLARIYQRQGNIQKAEEYYLKSLSDHKELIRLDYNTYIWDYTWTEDKVGDFYTNISQYEEAEKHLDKALSIISDSKEFPLDTEKNAMLYASIRDHLGWLNYKKGDYSASITHYAIASKHLEDLYLNDPDIYREQLARVYFYSTISSIYDTHLISSIDDKNLEKALNLYWQLEELHPNVFKSNLIRLCQIKVLRLLENNKTDEAIELAKSTYSMDESDVTSKEELAECYNQKAIGHAKQGDFTCAYESIDNAISLAPAKSFFYDTKGEILLLQDKKEEALEMWKKVLELNPDFLKDYPDGTNLSNGLKRLKMIE